MWGVGRKGEGQRNEEMAGVLGRAGMPGGGGLKQGSEAGLGSKMGS